MSTDVETYLQVEKEFLESEDIQFESQTVDLKRLESQLRVVTAGDGPPVLFVPGTMSTGVAFAGIVGHMPDYRCIMIDRPGTGLSPNLPGPPKTMEAQQHAADNLLADVLDGMGIQQSHIVCTSLGGWTTFRSAAAHPERFKRIFGFAWLMGARMEGAPLFLRFPMPKALLPRKVRAPRRMIPPMLKMGGMGAAYERGRFSEEMLNYMYAVTTKTEVMRNDGRYSPRPIGPRGPVDAVCHSPELLAKVTHPVRLFWGSDDVFGGEASATEFAAMLPNAELEMVEGAGHAPWMDEPELAVKAVRDHLAG